MVQPGLFQYLAAADDGTGAGFAGAEHQAGDAAVYQQAGAHGAGFEGDVEGGAGQAVVLFALGGFAQGDHFGVSAGVVAADGAIEAAGDDLTVTHQNGAHGHLAQFRALARFGDGFTHEVDISRFHQGSAPVPP